MLLIMFIKFLFLESYKMLRDLWVTLSLVPGYFMVFILFFITSMGYMSKGFIVIESFLNTSQGDPLGGPLFAFTHY
jgi:hypothetical protein